MCSKGYLPVTVVLLGTTTVVVYSTGADPPNGLSATQVGPTSIRVSWTALGYHLIIFYCLQTVI